MSVDVVQSRTLTDDQIEALLQEAENRLKNANTTAVVPVEENELTLALEDEKPAFEKRKPIPRLSHTLDTKRSIQEHNGVAHVAPELLVSKEQQKLADNLRTIKFKDRSKKDVSTPSSNPAPSNEEIYPNLFSTQTSISF